MAAELWPDLDEKGLGQSASQPHHLQKALEPGRKPETPSWYLLADGERLTLSEYVDIDVDEFDRLLVEASAWAVRAHRESPLDERAVRLLMSCLVATGDRVAALETADKLYAALQEAGLEPERLLSSS